MAPGGNGCGWRAEQLASGGWVAAFADLGEEAHDLQVRLELSPHEESVDRGHDRQWDRDQSLVGRDDAAVGLECLVEGEPLGTVDVEVAVGGLGRAEGDGDLVAPRTRIRSILTGAPRADRSAAPCGCR